jgi:hypothetical protein
MAKTLHAEASLEKDEKKAKIRICTRTLPIQYFAKRPFLACSVILII